MLWSLTWPWAGRMVERSEMPEPVTGGQKGPEPMMHARCDSGCCVSRKAIERLGYHVRPARWPKRSRRDHGTLTTRA